MSEAMRKMHEKQLFTLTYDTLAKVHNYRVIKPEELITADDVERTIPSLEQFVNSLSDDVALLKTHAAHVFAYRNAPNRAAALDKCDEVLRRLDRIRDIICRSIEGDDDVICDELDASCIYDNCLAMSEFIDSAEKRAIIKEDKR